MKRPRLSRLELVVVGDELLSGRVTDSDSAIAGRKLAVLGLMPSRVVRVGDDDRAIHDSLAEALARSDCVIVIGGLGPTPDDKTLAAVSRFFGRGLCEHGPTLRRVEKLFRARGTPMPKLARRQALVPMGARLLANPCGMVPGMILEEDGKVVVLLPGVPVEMEAVLTRGVVPYLLNRFRLARPAVEVVRTFGLAESAIAEKTARVLQRRPDVSPAFYPSTTGVDVVLASKSRSRAVACRRDLVRLLGGAVYAVGEESLEDALGRLLQRRRFTLATAESCTGGLMADRLTNVAGSSTYYLGGVVAYSNAAKVSELGVSAATLARYGAVSAETVREMAVGACGAFSADAGIAVSGIAGPSGGTRAKPVGLVFIAVCIRGRARVERHLFGGGRRMVKERAAAAALDLCRRVLERRA